ncbi:hypothetical protein AcV7_001902 [Taiwanofungus camphoratus]|nr:hypothetical protein AcV7_001902 [Antrodia cinnamomea]
MASLMSFSGLSPVMLKRIDNLPETLLSWSPKWRTPDAGHAPQTLAGLQSQKGVPASLSTHSERHASLLRQRFSPSLVMSCLLPPMVLHPCAHTWLQALSPTACRRCM